MLQHKLPPHAAPVRRIKEHIHALLARRPHLDARGADGDARGVVDESEVGGGGRHTAGGWWRVTAQPLSYQAMPAPVTALELGGGALLREVAGLRVEDEEEGFYVLSS